MPGPMLPSPISASSASAAASCRPVAPATAAAANCGPTASATAASAAASEDREHLLWTGTCDAGLDLATMCPSDGVEVTGQAVASGRFDGVQRRLPQGTDAELNALAIRVLKEAFTRLAVLARPTAAHILR